VGYTIDGVAYGLRARDVSSGVVVYGVVGSGKTSLLVRLAREALNRGYCVLALDLEGELSSRLGDRITVYTTTPGGRNQFRIDLLRPPPGVPAEDYAEYPYSVLVDHMRSRGWTVTPQMEYVLHEAVERTVRAGRGFPHLLRLVHEISAGLPAGRHTAMALESRLAPFRGTLLSRILSGPDSIRDPLSQGGVVDLRGIAAHSLQAARLVVHAFLTRVLAHLMAREPGSNARCIIMVDEANDLLPPGSEQEKLARAILVHGRKRGVGLVAAYHHPSTADSSLDKAAGTIVVFRLNNPWAVRAAAGLLGAPELEREIPYLSTGEAYIRAPGPYPPVRVKVEPAATTSDLEALIDSIVKYPCLTARERRQVLNWSGNRYTRTLREAMRLGLVEKRTVYTGRGRPITLLQLPGTNPSAPHRCAERKIIEELEAITGEPPPASYGAGPDVKVLVRGRWVAVEVETGTNLTLAKMEQRLEDYDYLIIVCTSRSCLHKARRLREHSIHKDRIAITTINGFRTIIRKIVEGRLPR